MNNQSLQTHPCLRWTDGASRTTHTYSSGNAASGRQLRQRQKNQPGKPRLKNLFLLSALIAALGLMPVGRLTAQTFTTLHNFTSSDGAYPYAGLLLSGNTLYGTAQSGGGGGHYGTVFKLNPDGTGFTLMYPFTGGTDGGYPQGALIASGANLYGTTYYGGGTGNGSVFIINTNGTGLATLHNFNNNANDSINPFTSLVLSGNRLYGTANGGSASGVGAVFAVNTDGSGYTNLHSFDGYPGDGAGPSAGLIISGNTLYGTTANGGSSHYYGTIFKINTDGSGYTILHNCTYGTGGYLYGGLVLSGSTLYGTAYAGGSFANGTVFALNTDGSGYTNLHHFSAVINSTNNDGTYPESGLLLSGSTLYGTASQGGSSGYGTVFALNTDGTGFTNLYSFTAALGFSLTNTDGAYPYAGLILSGNTLYGTAKWGGSLGYGTVFSLSLSSSPPPSPPQLSITLSGANVVLTWPTNAAGFALQSAPKFLSPTIWDTNSPAPVVADGKNTVTNAVSGTQKFYRLSQ